MTVTTDFEPLKYRRTRIVATVGPASRDPARLQALLDAGVNVFRINMSHGSHAEHRAAIRAIRELSAGAQLHTAILADLSGPKIRTGRFEGGAIELIDGRPVVVTTRDIQGTDGLIVSQYRALADDVGPGARILLNDGALELEVVDIDGSDIHCTVVRGGRLSDHKGINLPGVNVSAPSLTDKDRSDAAFALEEGADFIALSFVRRPEDMQALRRLVDEADGDAALIAKIEKPEALANAAGIIAACDGIMVARGDLGVELSPEQVPIAQHQLIRRAREAHKPVIVATQMLESMMESPRPTRAEATDVANAVGQGADAVML
ncbi:MAG: pyruvate kinase, partial [Gammaproteobacteria bacterium]|nr:pyruvate kinase [Gammaproteobacteria bacterium]